MDLSEYTKLIREVLTKIELFYNPFTGEVESQGEPNDISVIDYCFLPNELDEVTDGKSLKEHTEAFVSNLT